MYSCHPKNTLAISYLKELYSPEKARKISFEKSLIQQTLYLRIKVSLKYRKASKLSECRLFIAK